MGTPTYHIRIKKKYASAIIEDLHQVDTIEIFEDTILEWQKKETIRRLKEMKDNSSHVFSKLEFFKALEADEESI